MPSTMLTSLGSIRFGLRQISQEQQAEIAAIFELHDKDGSGAIDCKELIEVHFAGP